MHNSFDIECTLDGMFSAKSHNFPALKAHGKTEAEAIYNLDRMIRYLVDNDPVAFNKNVKDRLDKGLECACGVKLKEKPIAVKGLTGG